MLGSLLLAGLSMVADGGERAPAAGTLLVLNKAQSDVSLIDLEQGKEVARVATGTGPHEVAVSSDGRLAVVADYGDATPGSTLTVIDVAAAKVVMKIDLAPHRRPHGIAFLGEEMRVAVTSETSKALLIVDLPSGKVEQALATGQELSHMVALAPDGKVAAVANIGSGSITFLDLAGGTALGVVKTGAGSEGIDIAPDGKTAWVTNRAADSVSVVDVARREVLATLPCASFPIRVKVTPDSRRALVSDAKSGDIAVFDVAERKEIARFKTGLEPAAADRSTLGDDFSRSAAPIGILIHPDGRHAYVAHANVDAVAILDLEKLAPAGSLPTGKGPDGLGWSALRVKIAEKADGSGESEGAH